MIKTKGIIHFTIAVSNIERSEKFYTELLGLERVRRSLDGKMAFLKSGADYVVLSQTKTPIAAAEDDDHGVHHAFLVDPEEYDRALAFLREKGVRIIAEEEHKKGLFRGRSAYFHDPDRTVLELIDLDSYGESGEGF